MTETSVQYSFDVFQQIYCLSVAANVVGSSMGTERNLQAKMEQALAKAVPSLNGGWQVTWGPRVFNHGSSAPENVWYVATSEAQKLCVMAIAGTATWSKQGWADDTDVSRIIDFDAWTSEWSSSNIPQAPTCTYGNGTYISYGSYTGVFNVLSNTCPENAQRPNTRVTQYLQTLGSDYTVVFTGHSMGGALSPSVALGLAKAGLLGNASSQTLPSAGASPGNQKFNDQFAKCFPQGPGSDFRVYNHDFYNTNDIVPQAWSVKSTDDRNMNNICAQIYKNATGGAKTMLDNQVPKYIDKVSGLSASGMPYTPILGQSFFTAEIPAISTRIQLKNQMVQEHTRAYWQHIGITDFVKYFERKLDEATGDEQPLADTGYDMFSAFVDENESADKDESIATA